MKVVHIESGLGNQMLSYCEYLALKQSMPEEKIYIENIIYDIPECNNVICQWNGYELDRIFGIKAPNVKELFSEKQWITIMENIRKSHFWEKNWNYPVWFCKAFEEAGLKLKNIRGDFEEPDFAKKYSEKKTMKSQIVDSKIGDTLKRWEYKITAKNKIASLDNTDNIFLHTDEDIFTGQWLSFKHNGNQIERIDDLIKQTYIFPALSDDKSKKMKQLCINTNSVAIHVRRGDMLGYNGNCYKYDYFKRAVKYIRKHVDNPVFIFFCDPGSAQWCRENEKIFNLDFKRDKVYYVDWNMGLESYKDMQLISYCKHAIITNSSFGWWGAYLIENKTKITVSPDITINTTHHC